MSGVEIDCRPLLLEAVSDLEGTAEARGGEGHVCGSVPA